MIRAILRRACTEWEWIDRVPRFKLFREAEGRVRALSRQEFERLHRELPQHLADMALFSVATGLRQGTSRAWTGHTSISVAGTPGYRASKHKNGKPHSVPLNEMALDACCASRSASTPTRVFTFRGEPIIQV